MKGVVLFIALCASSYILPITPGLRFESGFHVITWKNATIPTAPSSGIWQVHFTMTLSGAKTSFLHYYVDGRLVATRQTDPSILRLTYISDVIILHLEKNDRIDVRITCGQDEPCGKMETTSIRGSDYIALFQ